MEADERHCPNCGRDVLSWDVRCPGCSQVPWDTPRGHRIIWWRRFWDTWSTGIPIAALLILVAAVVVIGNVNLTKHVRERTERIEQAQSIKQGIRDELERLLDNSRFEGPWKDDPRYEEMIAPHEEEVRHAQADLKESMQQFARAFRGAHHAPGEGAEDITARYEQALNRLRYAWVQYKEAIRGVGNK